jgi:ABC-type phosphate transport system substrate-binding protein
VIHRIAQVAIAAAFGALATLAVPSTSPAQTTTTTTSPSGGSSSGGSGAGVTLKGEGSNGPFKEVTTWQNDLAGAKSPITMNYTPTGTAQGRDDLLSGTEDFALSGTQFAGGSGNPTAPCSTQAKSNCAPGFTQAEINQLPHKSLTQDLIAAPVQVSALAFIFALPFNSLGGTPYGFERIDQFPCVPDPSDPTACPDPTDVNNAQSFFSPVNRQVRIPPANLSAMMLNFNGPDPHQCCTPPDWRTSVSSWDSVDVLNSFLITPPECGSGFNHCFAGFTTTSIHPASVVQSEPDELNYYLQSYMRSQAGTVWSGNKAATPGINWECTTAQQNLGQCTAGDVLERMPRVPNVSRQGADQAGDQLTLPGGTAGAPIGSVAGAIGALPPSSLISAPQSFQNGTPLQYIAIQNAAGNYVQPTPASIDAAVNAGNGAPLYAMTHPPKNGPQIGQNDPLASAYPLTWVNYLYVPSSGLSAEKTEAVATLIRYLATDGQAAAGPWGEGVLSKPLVSDALKAADQVVQSNCPGAHGTIVKNQDPGADAPGLPVIKQIGDMLHCVAPPPAAGGAAASPPTGAAGSTPFIPSLATTPAGATAPQAATKPSAKATPLPADLTADRLPFPLPGTPLDKIATFVVGVLGYFLLRGPISRRLGRSIE